MSILMLGAVFAVVALTGAVNGFIGRRRESRQLRARINAYGWKVSHV